MSDGNLGVDWLVLEDLKMSVFLGVMTSSAVYSSKSLTMLWNSVSLLVKGSMVMNRASSPVLGSQNGVAWLCRMTICGRRSGGNYMPLEMSRHP